MPGSNPSPGPTLFSPWFPSGCSGHWRGSVQTELAGGGESGPHPGPWQPRGGLLPTGLAAAAGCYQEQEGSRGLTGHSDSLHMTCGHGVQLQSPVVLLAPFDLAIC